jgi:GAF domain-containing protein
MTDWTPADYVVYGRYCEVDVLFARLEKLRIAAGTTAALLLAFRGVTLFHSLLLLSHVNSGRQRALQDRLVSRPFVPGRDAPAFTRLARDASSTASIAELASHPPFSELNELFAEPTSLLSPPSLAATSASTPGSIPASLHVLLFGPEQVAKTTALNQELDHLLTMVNASAPVVVHGSLAAEREADAAIDEVESSNVHDPIATPVFEPSLRDHGIPISEAVLQTLLDSALSLTRSSVGNLYFAQRDGETLDLAAATRNARPIPLIPINDPDSVVAWVYRRRRPMVINDITEYVRMHPTSGYRSVAGETLDPYAELAVPIVQSSLGSRGGSVVGVINVEKARPADTGYYTYRDLTLLRSVASRLSLWCAHNLLVDTSRSLAQLTRRHALPADLPTGPHPDRTVDAVPADAWSAKTTVDDILLTVYQLTRSHSATVRLLSPDRQHLVRFCAFPTTRLDDEFGAIPVSNTGSVNTWVARTSQECYIRSLRERGARRDYRGLSGHLEARSGTLSELCLPLFVNGRFVGTFNLESRYRDGYADSRELVSAVREQVSLALQHGRRAQEQTVLSMTLATSANVHEILKKAERLATAPADTADFGEVANSIIQLIDLGAADIDPQPSATTTEIAHTVIAELNYANIVHFRNEAPITLHHAGLEALILKLIFRELFRNAYAASLKVNLKCTIRWLVTRVGGKRYLTANVANEIRFPVAPETTRALFRVPVHYDASRTHIGAFTAGALARSLGGDVYVHRNSLPLFIVGLDLPLPDDQASPIETKE